MVWFSRRRQQEQKEGKIRLERIGRELEDARKALALEHERTKGATEQLSDLKAAMTKAEEGRQRMLYTARGLYDVVVALARDYQIVRAFLSERFGEGSEEVLTLEGVFGEDLDVPVRDSVFPKTGDEGR